MPCSLPPPRGRRAVLAALALATSTLAWAQASPPAPPADTATGEVRKIDRDPVRLTLRHGEIKSLDMPPMTMGFRVRPETLASGLKVGDRVRFRAEKIGSDAVITWIEVAP